MSGTRQYPNTTVRDTSQLKYGFFVETQPQEDIRRVQADQNRYVELVLNPDRHSVGEPTAMSIKPTQAGSYSSTNGWFVIDHEIGGQTGLQPRGPNAPSGHADFVQLRNMFRLWKDRTRANQYAQMYWFNFLEDEFWIVEPKNFRLKRDKSAPVSWKYDISFAATETAVSFAQRTQTRLDAPPVVVVQDTRSTLDKIREVYARASAFLPLLSGQLQNAMQITLTTTNSLISVVSDLEDSVKAVTTDLAINLTRQIDSELRGVANVLGRVIDLPEEVEFEVNRAYVELKVANDTLNSFYDLAQDYDVTGQAGAADSGVGLGGFVVGTDSAPTTAAGQAITEDFLAQIPDIERYMQARLLRDFVIPNSWSIEDVALDRLGSAHLYVVLIAHNKLVPPYIVPDTGDKPPGTLAWGETIYYPVLDEQLQEGTTDGIAVPAVRATHAGTSTAVSALTLTDSAATFGVDLLTGYTVRIDSGAGAGQERIVVDNTATVLTVNRAWTVSPGVGATYSVFYREFTLRKRVPSEVLTYGTDLLLRQVEVPGGEKKFDLVVGASSNDLELVAGMPNFEQAMLVTLETEQGSNKLHRSFGMSVPIGQILPESKRTLFALDGKRSLSKNSKVAEVTRAEFEITADVADFVVEVRPIAAGRARVFRRSVR